MSATAPCTETPIEKALLRPRERDGYINFDEAQCIEAGLSLSQRYQEAEPFPHIVIDDFLPATTLRRVLAEFPNPAAGQMFKRSQENLKSQYSPWNIESGYIRNLLDAFNSRAVLRFLEKMTGISGLIPDPHFMGGGLHEIRRGGCLGIHADFNIHKPLMLERRLNLLIYLNEDWEPDFGGELELWSRDMTRCEHRVAPILGRAVVFNTNQDSYHGHPDPLACPDDRTRRSIALYYYTALSNRYMPERTTVFRPRPGSSDKADLRIIGQHFVNDWIPPRLQRLAHGALRRIGLS